MLFKLLLLETPNRGPTNPDSRVVFRQPKHLVLVVCFKVCIGGVLDRGEALVVRKSRRAIFLLPDVEFRSDEFVVLCKDDEDWNFARIYLLEELSLCFLDRSLSLAGDAIPERVRSVDRLNERRTICSEADPSALPCPFYIR